MMTKGNRLLSEQEHHKGAFETYYAMGEKRSYRQVAQQMNVSLPTVKLWSRSFQWRGRVRERDAEVSRRVADRALQSNVDELDRNRKIVQMALVRLAQAIAEGKVRMQLSDLDRLIRLQSVLDGLKEAKTAKPTFYDLVDELDGVNVGVLRQAIEELKEQSRRLEDVDQDRPESTGPAV